MVRWGTALLWCGVCAVAGEKNPGHMHIHCKKSCEMCNRGSNKIVKSAGRKSFVV